MGSVQLFIKKMRKTETKSLDIGLQPYLTMFYRLVRPKSSSIRADRTQPAF